MLESLRSYREEPELPQKSPQQPPENPQSPNLETYLPTAPIGAQAPSQEPESPPQASPPQPQPHPLSLSGERRPQPPAQHRPQQEAPPLTYSNGVHVQPQQPPTPQPQGQPQPQEQPQPQPQEQPPRKSQPGLWKRWFGRKHKNPIAGGDGSYWLRNIPVYDAEQISNSLKHPFEHYLEAEMILQKVDESGLYGSDLGRDMIAAAGVHAMLAEPIRRP